jgi:hypothetical protein
MPREPKPLVELQVLATKGLTHRLYRLCMLASVDRGPAIRDALDRMIEGTATPPLIKAGRSYGDPKECRISLRLFRSQYRSLVQIAEHRGVKPCDVLRAAVTLACERMEKRFEGKVIGA